MWTENTRTDHDRSDLRYASDLRDAEWRLIAPLLPGPCRRGRPREVSLRSVVEAILYVLGSGCPWRLLPREFPARSTVQGYFYRWRDAGLWERIVQVLVGRARRAQGRKTRPSAAVVDTQSVKTTECGGPRGFDPAKKVKGRKRHLVTDTTGLPLGLAVHPADVQDNHGAVALLRTLVCRFPKLKKVFADRVYRDHKLADAVAEISPLEIEIVTRTEKAGHFVPEPMRWVIERSFAWLGRNRRLAKDFEACIATAETWIMLASVQLLVRRLARP